MRLNETGIPGALARYRVLANLVGVLLLVFSAALVVKYGFHRGEGPTQVISQVHGFTYVAYLVAAFDLARRARWSHGLTLAVLLAGVVPFLSFVAERKVVTRTAAAAGAGDRPQVSHT